LSGKNDKTPEASLKGSSIRIRQSSGPTPAECDRRSCRTGTTFRPRAPSSPVLRFVGLGGRSLGRGAFREQRSDASVTAGRLLAGVLSSAWPRCPANCRDGECGEGSEGGESRGVQVPIIPEAIRVGSRALDPSEHPCSSDLSSDDQDDDGCPDEEPSSRRWSAMAEDTRNDPSCCKREQPLWRSGGR